MLARSFDKSRCRRRCVRGEENCGLRNFVGRTHDSSFVTGTELFVDGGAAQI
jgi:hypothetical protein